MDLNLIKLLIEIVESHSFAAATRKLDMSKSNISQRLKVLEHETGAQLVRRSSRSFELTEAGQVLYASGRRMLDELDSARAAIDTLGHTLTGKIRISVPTGIGRSFVGMKLREFARIHPGISLTITFNNRIEDLIASEIDIALRIARTPPLDFSSLIGTSPASLEVKRQARRAARLSSPVLLLGKTGTGKELLAHAIHGASKRADGPLVTVKVAAIPDTLLDLEFLGAEAGAYTGADRKGRIGKFELAHGGTLFLDEIGDMPLALQGKLLRVLQEQEFEPRGSNRIVRTEVRIVAATSADLPALVKQGRFRADLYYRLNVLTIEVPPLRERLADIEAMAYAMLDELSGEHGTGHLELNEEAPALLRAYDWPGNVRELHNTLERAALMSDQEHSGEEGQ